MQMQSASMRALGDCQEAPGDPLALEGHQIPGRLLFQGVQLGAPLNRRQSQYNLSLEIEITPVIHFIEYSTTNPISLTCFGLSHAKLFFWFCFCFQFCPHM